MSHTQSVRREIEAIDQAIADLEKSLGGDDPKPEPPVDN